MAQPQHHRRRQPAAATAARSAAALALALAACCLLPPAHAQMSTPLMGSGSPGPNTTDVYLSIYLDRLLNGAELPPRKRWRQRRRQGGGSRMCSCGRVFTRCCAHATQHALLHSTCAP